MPQKLKTLSTKLILFHGSPTKIDLIDGWVTNATGMAKKFAQGGYLYRFRLVEPVTVFNYTSESALDTALGQKFPSYSCQTEHNKEMVEALKQVGFNGLFIANSHKINWHEMCVFNPKLFKCTQIIKL